MTTILAILPIYVVSSRKRFMTRDVPSPSRPVHFLPIFFPSKRLRAFRHIRPVRRLFCLNVAAFFLRNISSNVLLLGAAGSKEDGKTCKDKVMAAAAEVCALRQGPTSALGQ